MKATFLKGVVLGAVVSLAILMATAAFAGTGVGGIFNLGAVNTVNANTGLSGSTNGNMLGVRNTNTGARAGGIAISVAAGKAPLTVNSATQVKNLNANYLQGRKAGAFVQGTGTVTQSGTIQINPGQAVFLGSVPNMGALWGNCRNADAVHASVVLVTNNALHHFIAVTDVPNWYFSSGGETIPVTGDTTAKIGTAQIASDTHTATITATAADWITLCAFSAQSTSSG